MSEYYRNEIQRLQQEKALLLTKIGQSIYYQYRIGQIYSDELRDYNDKISNIDQNIHQLEIKLSGHDPLNSKRCKCGNIVDSEDTYCSKCGELIEDNDQDSLAECSICETSIVMQANFCHVCGTRQKKE